jgi:hypothetical protein
MNDKIQDPPMPPPNAQNSSAEASPVARSRLAPEARSRLAPRRDPVTSGLQRMFDTIAAEPIPDDFMRLLDSIEASAALLPTGKHDDATNGTAGNRNGAGNTNGGAK